MPSNRASSSTALLTGALLVLLYAIFPLYFSFSPTRPIQSSSRDGTEVANGSPSDTPVKAPREDSSGPPIYQMGNTAVFLGRKLLYGLWYSLAMIPNIVTTSANILKFVLSPVTFLLHPVILLLQIAVGLLVVTPVKLLLAFLSLLYPLYVFGAIACVCGLLVALCGRMGGDVLLGLILGPSNAPPPSTRSLKKRQ